MNKALGLVTFLALLSTAANAECIRPPKPASLPDGNTATRDEMVAANKLVKQYTTGVSGIHRLHRWGFAGVQGQGIGRFAIRKVSQGCCTCYSASERVCTFHAMEIAIKWRWNVCTKTTPQLAVTFQLT